MALILAGRPLPFSRADGRQLVLLFCASHFVFIAANLAVGITFSTLAQNQLQAMQMAFFFFLPSILLSGFMFPFRGMPHWAQTIGEVLPLTHFLRIVRGILLKGEQSSPKSPRQLGADRLLAVVIIDHRRCCGTGRRWTDSCSSRSSRR